MWYDDLTTEIVELLSSNEQLSATIDGATSPNWWDDIAAAIAEVLRQYVTGVLPTADTTAMTQAINDLQAAVSAVQNPVP